MIRPTKLGDLEVNEAQRPGQAPHLVLQLPSPQGCGLLDRQEAEGLRELLDEWLR